MDEAESIRVAQFVVVPVPVVVGDIENWQMFRGGTCLDFTCPILERHKKADIRPLGALWPDVCADAGAGADFRAWQLDRVSAPLRKLYSESGARTTFRHVGLY
jgi:hypothetical protein